MFDLFRFVVLRPASPGDPEETVHIDNDSELQVGLREASGGAEPRREMKRIANEFLGSDWFVSDPSALQYGPALDAFAARLDRQPPQDLETLQDAIRAVFDQDAHVLAGDGTFESERLRLGDSLLAAKAGDPPVDASLDTLARNLRLIALVRRAAQDDPRLNVAGAIAAARRASILLPEGLFPLPAAQAGPGGNEGNPNPPPGGDVQEEYAQLAELHAQLLAVKPADLNELEQPPEVEPPLPGAIDNQAIFNEVRDLRTTFQRSGGLIMDNSLASVRAAALDQLTLSSSALERFSPAANSALVRSGINLGQTSLPQAAEQVRRKLTDLTPQVGGVAASRSNVAVVGGQLYLVDDLPDMHIVGEGAAPAPVVLPQTHGSVKPVGVGDLLVVKQQIIGYEAGEIAYIENILKGEIHSRSVRRAETIEESTLTERENVSEEERDLQTTERFEMRRESEQVASMDGKLRSSAYGGLLEFDSSKDSPVHGSQQVAERQASTYGKEVTSRAVSKITERTRTQVMRRTVREFEEKTAHEFDNKDGAGHVVGIYQWVDKVYQAQVFNYGKRLLYDIIVPEPGAFLIQAFARALAEGRELVKPEPFTLQPEQVTEYNYGYYAAKYEATGIEPPPPLYQVVSETIEVPDGPQSATKTAKLTVPGGYEAVSGNTIQTNHRRNLGEDWVIELTVGRRWHRRDSFAKTPLNWSFILSSEVLSLPIALKCSNAWLFTLTVQVVCQRSDATYQKWKTRTHDVIRQAYQRQKAEYEERLANLEAALRVGALGQSADQKHALAMDELKKNCISIFTYQYYDVFNGINLVNQPDPVTGKPVAYAQIHLPDAETQGRYIRFFEQAFEWEQMMYHLYSYFWSRKNQWMNKVTREDRDAEFADFLKAGAARVVVPVRPGFEQAITHFMETGEIWEGGDLPAINSPLYVPLLDEIKAGDQARSAEVPYGTPWKLRLPTTLVLLRGDNSLPSWHEENGEWVPG